MIYVLSRSRSPSCIFKPKCLQNDMLPMILCYGIVIEEVLHESALKVADFVNKVCVVWLLHCLNVGVFL